MNRQEVITRIHNAYELLLQNDAHLFTFDANERSITHKLAGYLQAEFPEWNVDSEYNRDGEDVKTVPPWERRREELLEKLETEITQKQRNTIERILDGGISVYPDIIVHHRGTTNNLVVIEAKKSSYSGDDFDEEKLLTYKNDLRYQYAFKVTFPVAKDFQDANAKTDIQEV